MKTNLWGPHAWTFLHAASFNYPDNPSREKRESARELFRSLRHMLPCEECCQHYCSEFDKDPVDNHLDSKYKLSLWVVNFHNRVNTRLGKKNVSYEDARAMYDYETCEITTCGEKPKSPFPTTLLVVIVLFVLVYIKWKSIKSFMK